MIDTVIWIPPTQCGCEIEITGDWSSKSDIVFDSGRKIAHRRPTPFTITKLKNLTVCSEHNVVLSQPLDDNPYNYSSEEILKIIENNDLPDNSSLRVITNTGPRGYLRINDFDNATPEEKLFCFFWRFASGLKSLDTCRCKIYHVKDVISEKIELGSHPSFTNHCKYHKSDLDHSVCLSENKLKTAAMEKVADSDPSLRITSPDGSKAIDTSKVMFVYDSKRNLKIIVNGADDTYKKTIKDTLDQSFGTGKVEIG